jgi:hypothetical protein
MPMFGYNSNTGSTFGRHLCKYIGQTVTVFTVGGDPFTGTLLYVNCDFITLSFHPPHPGSPPTDVAAQSVRYPYDGQKDDDNIEPSPNAADYGSGFTDYNAISPGRTAVDDSRNKLWGKRKDKGKSSPHLYMYTQCDIPLDKIAAFLHYMI